MVEGCDCAVLQEGLHGFQCRRGGPHGRTDSHIHITRTIWAQTYRIRKNERRLSENTWYVKKYGVGRGGGSDKKKLKKTHLFGKVLFIWFTARALRGRLSVFECAFFAFDLEGKMWANSMKAHISPSKSKAKKAHSKTDKRPRKTRTVNQMNNTFFELGGGRVVRWCWVNFQCRGVLQFG